jgi:hypothetical protein
MKIARNLSKVILDDVQKWHLQLYVLPDRKNLGDVEVEEKILLQEMLVKTQHGRSLKSLLNAGAWAPTHDLRLTCPPHYPLGYCVDLIMKKKYQSYQNFRFLTRMRAESTRVDRESIAFYV